MRDSSGPQSEGRSTGKEVARGRFARFLWNAAGTFFLGLGIIGIPLPLFPTTPFLLVAAACYLRGSKRMYNWMMTNKYFGGYLKDYLEGRGLSIKTKVVSVSMLWAVITISAVFATEDIYVRAGLLAIATVVTIHILRQSTKGHA